MTKGIVQGNKTWCLQHKEGIYISFNISQIMKRYMRCRNEINHASVQKGHENNFNSILVTSPEALCHDVSAFSCEAPKDWL